MFVRALPLACAALLLGAPAWANPMATHVLRLRQMHGSTHVQVSFAVDTNYGFTFVTPKTLTRDGAPVTASWGSKIGFTTNTGSGLASTSATQLCDCKVSPGEHTYKATYATQSGDRDLTGRVTVVAGGAPYYKDAGVKGPDLAPWEIPEPSKLQGVDCNKVCGPGPAPDQGPAKLDKGTPAAVDHGTTISRDKGTTVTMDQGTAAKKDLGTPAINPEKEDEGCNLGHSQDAAPLALLALLALAARRRRK